MNKKLLVLGASGHAKDVISLARELGYGEFMLATSLGGDGFWGIEEVVIDDGLRERFEEWEVFVAIGENGVRRAFMVEFVGMRFATLCAPSAVIGENVCLGEGCYVGHGAYVGPDTVIGDGVLLNVGSVVGHDCRVGDYVQLGPRAVVLGSVRLGEEVFVGACGVVNRGSAERPLEVANRVSIGMTCAVMESITEEGVTLLPKPNVVAVAKVAI